MASLGEAFVRSISYGIFYALNSESAIRGVVKTFYSFDLF
jgi:hypothetical protein